MASHNRLLQNKQVLLGITGGIAAYKSAELVRLLQKEGASVRVIMTRAATEFITPLTLQALSGKPVHLELLDAEAEAGMGHIELARWADALLVAPASADFIARLALGRGDDLLTAVCLATRAPLAIAPAMNQQMWKNQATQQNCQALRSRGIQLFGPAEGEQACGDVGPGRMLEPAQLRDLLPGVFASAALVGKRVVVTAGPTREPIDPVRYLSNHSSGKMGFAMAEAAREAGAQVCLISGPTGLTPPARVEFIPVTTALEMHTQALTRAAECDIFIAAAAVADYRPASVSGDKIKKDEQDTLSLQLVKNPDIIADVTRKFPQIFGVGFAAETRNVEEYATDKMRRKNLAMIIANDVSNPDIGFNSDNNAVVVFWKDRKEVLPVMRKTQLASKLIQQVAEAYRSTHPSTQ